MAKKPGKRRRVLRSIAAIAGATARGIRQAATRGATSKYDVYVSEGDPASAAKKKAAESGGGGLTRAAKPSRRRGAAAPRKASAKPEAKKPAAKKAAPKKTTAKKSTAKKAAPKKTAAKKATAPKKTAAKQPAKKTTAKKATPKKQTPVDLTKTRTFDEFKADYREAAKAAKTGDRTAVANAEALRQYGIDNGVLTEKGNPRRSIPGDRVVGADAPQPTKATKAKATKADAPAKKTAPKATKAKTTNSPNQAAVDGHAARYADLDAKALDAEQKKIDTTRSRLDRLTPEQREGVAQALDERQAGLDKARATKGTPSKPQKATRSKPKEVKTTPAQDDDMKPSNWSDDELDEAYVTTHAGVLGAERDRYLADYEAEYKRRGRDVPDMGDAQDKGKMPLSGQKKATANRLKPQKVDTTPAPSDDMDPKTWSDDELDEAYVTTHAGILGPERDAYLSDYEAEYKRRGRNVPNMGDQDNGKVELTGQKKATANRLKPKADQDDDMNPANWSNDELDEAYVTTYAGVLGPERDRYLADYEAEYKRRRRTLPDTGDQGNDKMTLSKPQTEAAANRLKPQQAKEPKPDAEARAAEIEKKRQAIVARREQERRERQAKEKARREREAKEAAAAIAQRNERNKQAASTGDDDPYETRDMTDAELQEAFDDTFGVPDADARKENRAYARELERRGLANKQDTTPDTTDTTADDTTDTDTGVDPALTNDDAEYRAAAREVHANSTTEELEEELQTWADVLSQWGDNPTFEGATDELAHYRAEQNYLTARAALAMRDDDTNPFHADTPDPTTLADLPDTIELPDDVAHLNGLDDGTLHELAGNPDLPGDFRDLVEDELEHRTPWRPDGILEGMLADSPITHIERAQKKYMGEGGLDRQTIETLMTEAGNKRYKNTALMDTLYNGWLDSTIARHRGMEETNTGPVSTKEFARAEGIENYRNDVELQAAPEEIKLVVSELGYIPNKENFMRILRGEQPKHSDPLVSMKERFGTAKRRTKDERLRDNLKAEGKRVARERKQAGLDTPAAAQDAPAAAPEAKTRITRAERNQKALDGLANANFDVSTSELMEQGGLTRTQALAALKELEDAGLMYRSNEGLGGGGGERSGGRVKVTDLDWHVPESNLVDFYDSRGIDIDETDLYDDDYRNALTREAIGDVFGDVDIDKNGSQVTPPQRANNTPDTPDAPAAAQATPDVDDDDLAYTPDTELPPVAPEPPKTNPVTGDPLPTYNTPTPQQQKLLDQYNAALSNPTGDDARERVRLRRLLAAEGIDTRTDRDRRFDDAQIAYQPTPAETDPNNPGLYFAPNGAWSAPQTQKVSFSPGESPADLLHVTDDGDVIHITTVNPNKSNARVKLTGTNVHTGQPWSGKTDEYGNLTVRNRFPRHQTPQQHHATIEAREVYGSAFDNNNTDDRRLRAHVAREVIDRTPDIDGAPIVTDRDVEDAINRAAQKRKDTGLSAKPPRFATHEFAHTKGDPNTIYTRESFRLDGDNDLERAQAEGLYARTPDGTVAPVTDIKRFGYGYRITSTDADGKKHHTKLEMGTHFGLWQNAFTPERYENGQPMTKGDYEERQRLLEAASIARARYTDNPLEKAAGDRAAADIETMAEAIRTKNPEPPTPAQKVRQAAANAANRPTKSAYMARKPAERDAAVYEDALQGEASTTAQIAEATGMTRAQTLKTLNRLEQRGLIARQEQDDAAQGAQNRVSGGRNSNDDLVWVDNFRDGDAANERAALLDDHRNGTSTGTTSTSTGGSDAEAWASNIADDDVEEQWNILESRRRSDTNARAGVPGRELTTAERDELEARRKALRPRLEANKEATNARYDAAYTKASSLTRIRELTNKELFEAREGAAREKRRVGRGGGLAYEEANRRGRQLKAEQDRRRREGIVINDGDAPAPAPKALKPHRTGTAFTADHVDDGERLLINGNIERNGVEMTPDHRIIDKDGQPREQYRNMKALRKEADYQARRRQAPQGTTPAPSTSASADDNMVDYSAIGGFNLATLGTADLQRIIDEGGPQAADARRILADRARG